jgi:hypothetical protein
MGHYNFQLFKYFKVIVLGMLGMFLFSAAACAEPGDGLETIGHRHQGLQRRGIEMSNIATSTTQLPSGALEVSEQSTITRNEAISTGPAISSNTARVNLRNGLLGAGRERIRARRETIATGNSNLNALDLNVNDAVGKGIGSSIQNNIKTGVDAMGATNSLQIGSDVEMPRRTIR